MALEDYNKKRDFNKTSEPSGEQDTENLNRFVIQRHRASHLHYDLRLEMDGVLKSWAVPKGPSMNPEDKRLAVHTEDHPVKYLDFEGTIPKGNYGAGVMTIWDTGTYEINESEKTKNPKQQYHKGDLKVEFFGSKIKGSFALVRTNRKADKEHWLLIKKKDKYSTELDYDAENLAENSSAKKSGKIKELVPGEFFQPMLATTTKKIFNDPNWIYELKWDGYRMIAQVENGQVSLQSRNGINYNAKFPLLVKELKTLSHDLILDGEVVILNEDGIPNFQKLQNYNNETEGSLRYYVFDLLFLNGISTQSLSVLERKSLLPEIIADLPRVLYCDHIEDMGTTFYKKAIDAGMEGVIAKKKTSKYTPGIRSEEWLKVKAVQSEETLICGYTDSEGSLFGSLILGIIKEEKLEYVGNCGSGFDTAEQKKLLLLFEKLSLEKSPFSKKINLKGRKPNWIKPELICEVKFAEWTSNGSMRHPVYKGLRNDKIPQDITPEKQVEKPKKSGKTKDSKSHLEINGIEVPISNLDKIYWPESPYTKFDLINYYLQISETILPYLKDRPENLHRHPNGIKKPGFYHKDQDALPNWIETKEIHSKSGDKNIEYLICQDEQTLLYMANLGCIELNPWNSRISTLDNPDYTIIDLDPSEKSTFEEVIETAQVAKEILDIAGIKGYCKTSGSNGLHIYIPLEAQYSYDESRDFTKLLCYFIQERLPKLTSMERIIKNRNGKIYLDYLQNRKGQTLAAAYCIRPKPGATVSTPLLWKEVKKGLKISDFNIENMPERIAQMEDPFLPVLGKGINMEEAINKLNNAG